MSQQRGKPKSDEAPAARIAVASAIGTTIEWYGFFLHGTAASLVFNHLVFPRLSPARGVRDLCRRLRVQAHR